MNLSDQTHPQERKDRIVVNKLLQGDINNDNLCDLARLRIRYQNFPGAREIQRDLNLILQKWVLTEEELFQKTREIYTKRQVYKNKNDNEEDWS